MHVPSKQGMSLLPLGFLRELQWGLTPRPLAAALLCPGKHPCADEEAQRGKRFSRTMQLMSCTGGGM